VRFGAKPNHGRHRRDGNKSGRNNLVANQSVEQSRFASLELTDTNYIETPFGNSRRELACFLDYRLGHKFKSQFGQLQQA
jgi:hypothetical protein